MKRIILASSSPRRKDILNKMNLDFEIIPSTFEEILDNFDFDYKKIEDFACNKAKSVLDSINTPAFVIGADTVVVLDGKILGKPKNEADAKNMLESLSGQNHSVVTSICIIDSETREQKILSTTSYVEFEKLSEEQINYYIEQYKPFDKAGSYGIQELPEGFIKNINGSLENIIGLCSASVQEALNHFK